MAAKPEQQQGEKTNDLQHKQGQEQNRQSAADTSAEVTGRNQSAGARGGSNQQRAEAGRHNDKSARRDDTDVRGKEK